MDFAAGVADGEISIHAPRMGSDWRPSAGSSPGSYFNPRSPDGERQATTTSRDGLSHISIHAPRMGSDQPADAWQHSVSISIHAPRMGSDCSLFFARHIHHHISIHAPRMGSDSAVSSTNLRSSPFQSTLPGWGATVGWSLMVVTCMDFNPRSPDGERPRTAPAIPARHPFQSTLPGWGATLLPCLASKYCNHFNPRSPDGERPTRRRLQSDRDAISIHAPRMGSDPSVV